MAIVLFLGANVKEYEETKEETLKQCLAEGRIRCDICTQPMKRHSSYTRSIRETGEKLDIAVVFCKKCGKWHALLPDFLLPHKQYSADEVESVLIDSQTLPTIQIETAASEPTVRRWIAQMGERLKKAVSIIKYLFAKMSNAVSEIAIEPGGVYSELEQLLSMVPKHVKTCGNRLGLANIWLGTHDRKALL
jgi:hypothetical protein